MKLKLQSLFKERKIKSITFDSRQIKEGDVFFAIKGKKHDGNDYILDALQSGASFAFTDDMTIAVGKYAHRQVIHVSDVRECLAISAGVLYPELPSNIIAVTGTNGKSSVVSYIHQILSLLNYPSSAIGTLGVEYNRELTCNLDNNEEQNEGQTTYDPISFRMILDTLKKSGIENVAFEASSHGIEQKRLGDVKFKYAAFTSFSQDHLDYHQTMENYLQSKLKLFSNNLEEGAEVVINSELLANPLITEFLEQNNIKYCSVGTGGDINITNINSTLFEQEIVFEYNNKEYSFATNIIGSFQAVNILIAAKLVHNLGIDFNDIISLLPKLKAVKGRLDRITAPDCEFQIFVDYACTPDALEKSINELKRLKHKDGRLWLLFGCGGDRDASKRPIMGKIAAQSANFVIITDDNPRTEDATKIRDAIAIGTMYSPSESKPRASINVVADREDSIIGTIWHLRAGDIMLIAGKGHEDYQIIGTTKHQFSDIEIAKKALKNKLERKV